MSEEKFTQGEWKALIKTIDAKPLSIFQDTTIQAGEHDVASVFLSSDDPDWLKYREQAIRDAHLIASAPDMYEMLEYNRRAWINLVDLNLIRAGYEKDAYKLIDEIESLLAKARGEL